MEETPLRHPHEGSASEVAGRDEIAEHLGDLVRRLRAGDGEALHGIVIALQDELGRQLSWHLEQADVDEVLQETFLTVYRRIETYRTEGSFRAWVHVIAHNHMLHLLRRRKRHYARQAADFDLFLIERQIAGIDSDADSDIGSAAVMLAMQRCLELLAPRARTMIEGRHMEGRSLAELAVAFKRPKRTLASTLCRIRTHLRNCIENGVSHAT